MAMVFSPKAARSMQARSDLPTSLLIDKEGCEIGVIAGPAAWDGADGEGAIAALLGRAHG